MKPKNKKKKKKKKVKTNNPITSTRIPKTHNNKLSLAAEKHVSEQRNKGRILELMPHMSIILKYDKNELEKK